LGNSNRITSISFNIYLLLDITFHFIILIYFSYLNRSNSKKKKKDPLLKENRISYRNQINYIKMLSPEEINDIHYQLNNIPSSFTNKRKRELRHELNKVLKEHEYASTYLPYEPTEYEVVFINRITSINTLITLDAKIKETNIFTLDTESISRKFRQNVPALIQLQLCSETSSIVIIVEVHHLPKQNQKEFQLIKNLFKSLFIKENKIFIWGEIEELEKFIQFDLFNLQQIYSSTNRNVQDEFKLYWEKVYPHHENRNEECQCKNCFGINHDGPLALQDAVAFELRQWLDKRLTRQSFNIGLDPKLRRLNPREFQYRQSLYTYAANDCDAIYRIIIHSDIINNQYSENTPIVKFNDEVLLDVMDNELENDGIILDVLGESNSIINSTEPATTSAVIYNEPQSLEPISSDDEEPMDVVPKQKQLNKSIKYNKPEPEPEPEPEPSNYDRPKEVQLVQVDPNSQTINVKHTNPLSEAERKKIHNRSRTKHQRTRAYAREIILYNIEKRFPVKMIKQMLKERGVLFTQVNPVTSKRTGQVTLYIGIKEPIQVEKYEEIKELFTYKNYRRLFPYKSKRPPPRAHEYGQRNYRNR
jgi:hypothetical protein